MTITEAAAIQGVPDMTLAEFKRRVASLDRHARIVTYQGKAFMDAPGGMVSIEIASDTRYNGQRQSVTGTGATRDEAMVDALDRWTR